MAERPEGPVLGVILAGGLARRMGGVHKGLLKVGGQSVLAHVMDRVVPQVDQLLLNLNTDPADFQAFGLPIARDVVEGHAGPLAGMLTGMAWARAHYPDAQWILSVAADTPFVPQTLVQRLMAAARQERAPLALARSGRRHPVFALCSLELLDDLEKAVVTEGVRKVTDWTDRHPVACVDFSVTPYDPFFNINTEADLRVAEELARSHGLEGAIDKKT